MARVAVAGTMGRMGTIAREALQQSGEYAGGLSRVADPELRIVTTFEELMAFEPDVLLDLTVQPASYEIASAAVARGLHTVVGASGWSGDQRTAFGKLAEDRGVGALIVPNFSIGAVLMMRFAQEAAQYFAAAEIVEMHRASKLDKPSGTSLETAGRIERVAGHRPEIHSVRLPGLLAHQEVLFGGTGEILTIRHDSLTRESFVGGILASVRGVVRLRGLSIGLESVLEATCSG
jgi:4-hydroxy-tetrahydrodipicolinate reductase